MDDRARRFQPMATALELPLDAFPVWSGRYEDDCQQLAAFHESLRAHRRVLAKRYHPDVIGGNGERLKGMNALIDRLLAEGVPMPQPAVHVIIVGFGGFRTSPRSHSSTWSSSTWSPTDIHGD